jgi:hypothetical protein
MGDNDSMNNKNKILIFLCILLIILPSTLADTAVINITPNRHNYWLYGWSGASSMMQVAQSFRLDASQTVTRAEIYHTTLVGGSDCGTDFFFSIKADNVGLPSTTLIQDTTGADANITIHHSNLTQNAWQQINWTNTIQLNDSTTYWFVAEPPNGGGTNCGFLVDDYNGNTYLNGTLAWANPVAVWATYANDLGFILYNTSVEANTSDIVIVNEYTKGGLWMSFNGGKNWTGKDITDTAIDWALTSNQDASIILIGEYPGSILRTTDNGTTITETLNDTARLWYGFKGTPTLERVFATEYDDITGAIWMSEDYGLNWTKAYDSPKNWTGLCVSKDGKNIYASTNNDYLYRSTNAGRNWSIYINDIKSWTYLAGDENCTTIYATTSDDNEISIINTTTGTYTNRSMNTTTNAPQQIDVTPDGKDILITYYGEFKRYSTDYGVTWNQTGTATKWIGSAINTNGSLYVAGTGDGAGYIWKGESDGQNITSWWQKPDNGSTGRWEAVFIPKQNQAVTLYTIYCMENWTLDPNSCLINDSIFISYTDQNACNTTENLPEDNGTWDICDYCSPDVTCEETECVNGLINITCTDNNFWQCCWYTMLEEDCPLPETFNFTQENCSEPTNAGCDEINLTQNFTCQYDPIPILHEKMNIVCTMPDADSYRCVTSIYQGTNLLATNPEYRDSGNSLLKPAGDDTREFFTPEYRLLNAEYTPKNLRTETNFMLEVRCTSNTTERISQYCVNPTYDKPDWIINRGTWMIANAQTIVIIAIIFTILMGVMIYYVKRTKRGY